MSRHAQSLRLLAPCVPIPLLSVPRHSFVIRFSDSHVTPLSRADDPSTYTAKDPATGQPVNFQTHIHRSLGKPKSQIIESHTKIKPVSEAEKTGARWMSASS